METSGAWIEKLNNQLKLKSRLYTIMVHGIPTTFDITNDSQVTNFQFENGKVLDSMESILWANTNSIANKKPFSSIFISLRDPDAANAALYNNIIYQRLSQ